MSDTKFGVVAVGNALVDVLSQVPETFIEEQKEHGMEKGAMTLIDEVRAVDLYTQMPQGTETSGGSAANTMAGFASFGGQGAFIGKVADDNLGKVFQNDIKSLGVNFATLPLVMGAHTGRCMILVTPDADRTMNTFLGASVELSPVDIDADLIASAKITYLEGYLFDREQAKAAFIAAANLAHENGRKIALTLSDPFCVDRHRDDFLNLVENHVEIAAITRSEKGAIIIANGETIKIDAVPVEKVIDTTGAGDQFAAGFLYGHTEGKPLAECGKLGAIAAAEVISHIGPRPAVTLADLAA